VRGSRRRLRLPLLARSLRARLALAFAIAVVPTAAVGAVAIDRLEHAKTTARASAGEARAVARLGVLVAADDPASRRRVGAVLAERDPLAPAVRGQVDRFAAEWRRARRRATPAVRRAYTRLASAEETEQARRAGTAAADRREVAYLGGAIGVALVLAVLAAWGLAARVVRPLRRLRDAAALIGHERLGFRLPVEREDEIGELASAVNELAERLASTRRDLDTRALHDPLTLLPNSGLLVQRVVEALERARRSRRPPVLLWVGLDNLEALRGSLGGEPGDRLLRALAARISGCVRPGDTVARVGDEGFAILLEDLAAPDAALPRAERVLDALRRRRHGEGPDVVVRASIGLVRAQPATKEPDDLFRAASLAMQAARAQGGDRYVVFSPAMQAEASDRLSLERDLREAIERRRLALAYQPLFDLRTGAVCGLEALVRWTHPERGPISPGVFVPVAEATGLIVPLGRFVLSEACADTLRLRRRGSRIPVGVNVSRRQLDQPHLVEDVRRTLQERGFAASELVLEVTETAVTEDATSTIERLDELRSLGIRVALDDFGTGYSSLGSLKTLPIDIVKIDRSFVSDLSSADPPSLEFVRTVVDLGRALGLRTVAEGIEQEEQVEVLRALGCDEGQGFHLGKPMELGKIGRVLAEASEAPLAVS
jgi:diguanylate cyclase (GGDEF)-like protein